MNKARNTIRYKILRLLWLYGQRVSHWAGLRMIDIIKSADEKNFDRKKP